VTCGRMMVTLALCVGACGPQRQGDQTASLPPGDADTEAPATVTVREILESGTYLGHRVRVSGRCLGYSAAVAEGGPPLTRSDWQLEDDGVAVYVSGSMPDGCSPTQGSTGRTAIDAVVAQDTVPALGDRLPRPRRYLIRTTR